MTRKRLSTTQRIRIFRRHGGICEFCVQPIQVGQAWEVSHSIPLALGGEDAEGNWRPAHKACHRAHTSSVDQPRIAKAKAQEAVHIGAKRPKQRIKSRGFPHKPKPPKLPLPEPRGLFTT